MGGEEALYLRLSIAEARVKIRKVIAKFLRDDRPRHLVGVHLLLSKSLDSNLAILVSEIVNTSLDA